MFYRHYKGGIYYALGVTTQLKGAWYLGDAKYFQATHTETEEKVNIFMFGGKFYVLYQNHAEHILYIGGDGRFWLRPKEMFHGTIEIDGVEVPRFELIK